MANGGDAQTTRSSSLQRLLPRKSSPTLRTVSTFNPSDILPHNLSRTFPEDLPDEAPAAGRRTIADNMGDDDEDCDQRDVSPPPSAAFGAQAGVLPISASGSVSPPSVFDPPDGGEYGIAADRRAQSTQATTALDDSAAALDEPSYDLKPPAPAVSPANLERLAVRLFSSDHLDVILRDRATKARLSAFLAQYRPQHAAALARYVEAKKALAAVEYANAVAETILPECGGAAVLDTRFNAAAREAAEDLVEDALPAYVTHRLVALVTDTLVKEITGNNMPIMRDLVPSLAEVYCVTDPSLPDNPIVYASDGRKPLLPFLSHHSPTNPRCRILPYHAIRPRIRAGPQLPLPARPAVVADCGPPAHRRAGGRAGNL